MRLRCKQFEFEFPRPALVMGILNITPDSFSDGGRYVETKQAIERGLAMAREGADIVDVGGESTRPNATEVPEGEEMDRILPVIQALARELPIPISIDTRRPAVAKAALEAGASIVNDVEACRDDAEMWRVVADSGAGYVAMHMRGTPSTMQEDPQYGNVTAEIDAFFAERLRLLAAAGVEPERVVLDPGFGFGKTTRHNLELLSSLGVFMMRGRPLLVGVSRKSFIGKILDHEVGHRLAGSLACVAWAILRGAQLIRAHDVRETVDVARMIETIQAVKSDG